MRTPGTSSFRLRDIALAAYAPSAVSSVGFGAVIPVLALRARDLGAGVDLAGPDRRARRAGARRQPCLTVTALDRLLRDLSHIRHLMVPTFDV